jgi:hypothetical protein
MNIAPCKLIAAQLGDLFVCSANDPYIRIRTPFLYPDGDVIDLFLRPQQGEKMLLTDLGESLRWLRTQTASSGRRSPHQQKMLQDVCQTHGIELFKGMLVLREVEQAKLADAVMRLGQAALRVGDLWFTMRTRAAQSTTDEVEDILRDQRDLHYERGKRLSGRSGREYTVDFDVHARSQHSLLQVLSTSNRAATSGIIEHVYTLWSELRYLKEQPERTQFVSLLDDSIDVWGEGDLRLLGSVSDCLVRWSRPDEVEQALQLAA